MSETCARGHSWEIYAYVKKNGHRFCKKCCNEARKRKARLTMKQPERILTPVERFWLRLDKTPGNGPKGDCWIWTGTKTNGGYGIIAVNGRTVRTHRFAWELLVGPIPDKMILLHSCDNPPCCRPDHLRVGTHLDNVRDKIAKGRGPNMREVSKHRRNPNGERNGMAKLSRDQANEIRRLAADKQLSYSKIGKIFGVSVSCISRIAKNIGWRENAR